MAEPVILIKKYPNRRLYDTSIGAYITLADIKSMVLRRECFQIEDFKTGKDLTRSVLLQIILDEEAGGAPILTSDMLSRVIRFYGNTEQGLMGKYLESNIRAFSDLQEMLSAQESLLRGEHPSMSSDLWARFLKCQRPAVLMGAYIAQSQEVFKQMQELDPTRNAFADFPFLKPVSPAAEVGDVAQE